MMQYLTFTYISIVPAKLQFRSSPKIVYNEVQGTTILISSRPIYQLVKYFESFQIYSILNM